MSDFMIPHGLLAEINFIVGYVRKEDRKSGLVKCQRFHQADDDDFLIGELAKQLIGCILGCAILRNAEIHGYGTIRKCLSGYEVGP